MTATAQAVLNVARSQLGVIEKQTNRTKFGAWFGWDGVPWCDIFVSYCAATAGAGDIIPRSAAVHSRLVKAKAKGLVNRTPSVGALVCFDFDRDGHADHIGIVEHVLADGRISTIEGNTSSPYYAAGSQVNGDGVYRRNRSQGLVLAYIHPRYAAVTVERPAPNATGIRPLVVDGNWGPLTTRHLQLLLHVTPVDGVFDRMTVRSMQRWLRQAPTGVVGKSTKTALQHRVGVQADGEIGPLTVRALQRYLNRALN